MPAETPDRQRPPDQAGHRAGGPKTVRRTRLSRHHAGRHHVGRGKVAGGVLPVLRRQGRPAGRPGGVVSARRRRAVRVEPAATRLPGRRRVLHLGGHRLLEHVQAEHRHHDRRRAAGRHPATLRGRPERIPALRHGYRGRVGAPRPGAGLRNRAQPAAHRGGHRAAVRELHHRLRRASGPAGLDLEISDEDAIATLSTVWKKTLYGA